MKTWSHSQTRMLRICERRWFLSYGLSPRINSSDPFLREIAFLKKLKTSFMWRGDVVHGVIAEVLRGARQSHAPDIESAVLLLKQRALDQWKDSQRRAQSLDPRSSLNPEGPILFEHYYSHLSNGLNVSELISPAERQLRSLYLWIEREGLFEKTAKANKAWIDPSVYFPNSPGFRVGGVRFITKVDLGLLFSDRFSIYDWKTSDAPQGDFASTHEHGQVSYYALWPHLEMNFPIENVEIKVVYVGGDEPKARNATLDRQDVEGLIADVELIVDAVSDFFGADSGFTLEDFDWATSGKSCVWCPFQKVCRRELK